MATYIRSGTWKQVKEIYVRVGNAWKTVNSAWVRVGNAWKQVHNPVETPYPSGDITIRDYLDVNIIDNDTYPANVGDTIYGHRGPTWINNPTAFQYRWRYATESGGTYVDFSPAETSTSHPSPLNTSTPLARINDWDNRWIVYQVRAQNALGWSEWFTSINEAHLVKYKPQNLTISITGTPGPFSTLTAANTWQTTFLYTGDWAPSDYSYVWYDNTTEEILLETTHPTKTFTPAIEDLDRYVRVEVTATNSGGSTTAVSAAVGPIEFVLAVEIPDVVQDTGSNNDIVLDNRGGIINGVFARVSTNIYGVTQYTSYRVRYRYRNLQTGVYLLYGASSTATASWVTRTANSSGVGSITNVDVDDVNRVAIIQDVFYIDPIWYDGSTYTAGAITNGPKYQVEIQVSVIRTDGTAVSRTLTYGISAAPVATINTASTTVGTNRDVVFTGTVGGLGGKPAYPIEVFLDFDDGTVDTQLFSEGDRNPTYSITHQFGDAGTYNVEVSTDPQYTSATKSVTVSLAPGSFNIISVVKGLSNGTSRPVTVTWEQSVNATLYEVQIQRQYSGLTGWVTVQTFADSVYTAEPTRTRVFNVEPVAKYYQVSVRATRFTDVATAAYSGGGTLASPVYVEAVGIAAGAPTSLAVSNIATTSATVSFTAPTSFGSAGLYTYQWSLNNIDWVSTYSNTSPAAVYGLTGGTSTTVYVRAMNLDDVGGTAASITFTTASPPGVFNITSAVKAAFSSSLARSNAAGNSYPGNGARAITINWSQSANATQYEVQVEGRDYHPIVYPGASQTWAMLRELDLAPYVSEPTRTETFNARYYYQYRVTARARVSGSLESAAYSGGGSAGFPVYFDVTGTGPGKPAIGTIIPSKNSASVPFTNSTSTGSESFALTQWSLNQTTWTTVSTSPFTISGLESNFFYTVYMRSFNYDGESSATPHAFKSFTTPTAKPPNTPTSPTTSGVTSTNITFSWTAPGTDATHNAATSYLVYTNATGSTPSSGGIYVEAPTTSSSFTYTASASPTAKYFWVRAVNDDGESSLTTVVSATPSGLPSNSVAPGISTDTGNYSAGSIITGTTGTWSNAASYLIEIARSAFTPITSDSALVSNVYTITTTDAVDPSFYFAVKVTAYTGAGQTGSSVVAYSETSPISTLVPTVSTPTLGTPTNTGFTVTWTSGPTNYHTSNVQIYNASQTLLTTISSATSPYVWTGGSANTTYYVKVRVVAQDTSATSVTSGFSSSMTTYLNTPENTVAPTLTPTSGNAGTTTFSVNSNGTWNNVNLSTVFTYQWQYLAGNPQNLASEAEVARGSTSASYSPPSNYVTLYGSSLRCVVTATNVGGSSSSEPTSNVATVSVPAVIPAGSVSVSGSLTLNSVLTCSVANVTGGASYTYQWYYGFSGVANTVQMGAVSSTLTLLSGDIPNQYFKCIVVATSSTGNTTTFTSNIVGPTYSAPAQVTGVTATVTSIGRAYNDGEIGVSWTAPANNGSAITGYLVQSSSNGGSSWTTFLSNWTGGTSFGSSPWGIGTYIFRVAAINAAGTGTFSANSNNAVVTTVPQAPTIGTATAGNGTVSVTFTAGATGGSSITGYTVTSSSGNTGTGVSSPISVSETNGTARTYTVTATNANGTSVASSASNSATPSSPVRITGAMRRVTMPVSFTNSSQPIWVTTNGYVSVTVDPTTSPGTSWPTAGGVVVGPAVADMKQVSLFTLADASNYYVRWRGHGFSETAGSITLDYLMKFYWGSSTVDVYFITNSTTASLHPSSIYYGTPPSVGSYALWDNSTSISGMTIPAGLVQDTTLPAETDDNRTAITATKPLSNLTTNPAYGAATSASGGWTASITTAANPSGGTYSVVSQTAGSASVNSSTGALTASGLTASGSSTVTVRYSLSGYNSVDITKTGTAAAAVVSVPAGGTVSISTNTGNYNVGSIITYSTTGWSNSPTSYSLRLYNGTNPVLTSDPQRGSTVNGTSGTYTITSADVPYYFKAFATASNSGGTSTEASSAQVGPAVAAAVTTPVLISLTGNNSLTLGGTFTWSFTNSPTIYSILCTGPSGTVYTTSNAFTYSGTTFRPGYDGTGWQGSGTYTMYVTARNAAGGTSTTASVSQFMS